MPLIMPKRLMEDFLSTLINTLQRHEGYRQFVYEDTLGHPTIGYGHLLSNGISRQAAYVILKEDVMQAIRELDEAKPMWKDLPIEARLILANMAFNLGIRGLLGFRRMWAALEAGDFVTAAKEMRDSRWFRQVGNRGIELAAKMERVTNAAPDPRHL